MKVSFPHVLFAASCIAVISTGSAFARTTPSTGGTIHFAGNIVEDPCDLKPQSSGVAISCYRGGKVNTNHVSYHAMAGNKSYNGELVTVGMRYINPQKSLAIIDVEYR